MYDGSQGFMFDCGISFRGYNEYVDDYNVKTILLSHEHNDHVKGIKENSLLLRDLKVIGEEKLLNKLNVPLLNKCPLEDKKTMFLNGWNIVPFEVPHDVTNFAYLMQNIKTKHRVLYLTDCGKMEQYTIKDIDTFVIEANYDENYIPTDDEETKHKRTSSNYGHASIQETIRFLKKNVNHNTKNIFLVHISHSFKEYKVFERMVREELPGVENIVAISNRLGHGIVQKNKIIE